jgi:hypothetical protein
MRFGLVGRTYTHPDQHLTPPPHPNKHKNPPKEELVRRTQQEFLTRVTRGLPPSMTFVYAIGNNDLWPNNKNSVDNFVVGKMGGTVSWLD